MSRDVPDPAKMTGCRVGRWMALKLEERGVTNTNGEILCVQEGRREEGQGGIGGARGGRKEAVGGRLKYGEVDRPSLHIWSRWSTVSLAWDLSSAGGRRGGCILCVSYLPPAGVPLSSASFRLVGISPSDSVSQEVDIHNLTGGPTRGVNLSSIQSVRDKRANLKGEEEAAPIDGQAEAGSSNEVEHRDTPEPEAQTFVISGEGCSFRRSGKNEQPISDLRPRSVRLFGRELKPDPFSLDSMSQPSHTLHQNLHHHDINSDWRLLAVDYGSNYADGRSRVDATYHLRNLGVSGQYSAARPVTLGEVHLNSGEGSSGGPLVVHAGGASLTPDGPLSEADANDSGMERTEGVVTADRLRESLNMAYTYLGADSSSPEDPDMDFEIRSSLEASFCDSQRMIPFDANVEYESYRRAVVPTQRGAMLMKLTRTERKKLFGGDKAHSKRAKFLPLSGRRRHSSVPSRGSSPSSSSSSRPGSPHGWEQHGRQPPNQGPLQPVSRNDGGEPMESDDAGGEGGDDGGQNTALDANDDGEVRMDLTDDLLHKVFSFLDDTALCQAAMVCKQWRAASAHEDFWKSLNFENRRVSHEQVGRLCVRYPKATQLNLRGAPCVDEVLVREAIRSLRNLEVLTLGRGFLSDGFFYALAVECSSLQNLSITDAVLGNGGAQEIQLRHDSLRRLQIQKCRVLRIAIRCPQLEYLCLKRTGTASAMLHCPRLITLDVSSCHKLSDAGVRAAATACPLLASLDISNCAYVSDETLREISIACNNLRTLDASYCPNISLEGVRMPMLIDLKLQGCEGIISSSMAALSSCSMLEVLSMDFCWLLTAVNLDLPRLRQISLSNNRKFVELILRSPALVSLNLTNCPFLSRVDITSSSLQSLALRQQNGLSSMALQCPWLREVDLTECESLTNAVCDVFSDSGCCPRLSSLILDSCEGLTEVKLSSCSIQSLSLVGCRNIQSLSLACPVLQHLVLDGCDHLQQASFSPVGLYSLNLGICPHLVKLEVEASQMTLLDLRGCGILNQAAIRCPSLSSLDASYCGQLGDDCLTATTYACPAIQSLVLASCPSVGPVGLLALKRLRNLTMLDLSYTFLIDLSPIFEACPRLQVLRLSACKYLPDNALDALHGGKVLPELRELDLSYGSLGHVAIERVMALCPHLSQVSLNGCAHVTDLLWACLASPPAAGVSSKELSYFEDTGMEDALTSDGVTFDQQRQPVDITRYRDISSRETTAFTEECVLNDTYMNPSCGSSLEAFSLCPNQGFGLTLPEQFEPSASIESEGGSVRALQSLSCVGCPHIKRVVLPRFAACLYLTSLNLSLSVNIREVILSCTNLTSLNLSNCSGLVVLELECPRLMSLFLQACGIEARTLELAIQGCSQLETLDLRNCAKVSASSLAQMRAVCPGLKRLYNTVST
ncbi:hypothetical protein R1flu_016276 [Riccia fluitans]|uniref:F-box domain-containing protein n=1 Tax=Riccia fluitans TaxID=41844 RepID=A0ABD1YLS3_9MARC